MALGKADMGHVTRAKAIAHAQDGK